MKKIITGFLLGAMIFGSVPAFAASIKNLIGAKVTGIYTVEQNGKRIADGVIINGSAYVPVRSMAVATGTELTVEGKTIILGEPEGNALSDEALKWTNKSQKIKGDVSSWRILIEAENEAIKTLESKIAEEKAAVDKTPGRLEALETNLAKSQAYVDELQVKIDVAEAEIKRLQTLIDGSK